MLAGVRRHSLFAPKVDAHLPDGPSSRVVEAARAASSRPTVVAMSGGALAEIQAAVPGADLHVEKVRLPDRLDEIVGAASRRAAPSDRPAG